MKKAKLFYVLLAACLCLTFVLTACGGKTTEKSYKVTFLVDGAQYNSVTVKEGESIQMPADPTKTGYTFRGWYYSNNTERKFNGGEINENVSVTAIWDEVVTINFEYTVYFVSNGGSAVAPVVLGEGDVFKFPTEPTLFGHGFVGWFLDDGTFANEFTPSYFNSITESGSVTVYAKWIEVEPEGYGTGKLKAPDFTVYTLDGKAVKLSDFYGKQPVFLSFWTYNCGYCKDEMRLVFNPVYEEMKDKFELLCIHASSDTTSLLAHLETITYTFPIYEDKEKAYSEKGYGDGFVPKNYMIDKWGYLYKKDVKKGSPLLTYNIGTLTTQTAMKTIINAAIDRVNNYQP